MVRIVHRCLRQLVQSYSGEVEIEECVLVSEPNQESKKEATKNIEEAIEDLQSGGSVMFRHPGCTPSRQKALTDDLLIFAVERNPNLYNDLFQFNQLKDDQWRQLATTVLELDLPDNLRSLRAPPILWLLLPTKATFESWESNTSSQPWLNSTLWNDTTFCLHALSEPPNNKPWGFNTEITSSIKREKIHGSQLYLSRILRSAVRTNDVSGLENYLFNHLKFENNVFFSFFFFV